MFKLINAELFKLKKRWLPWILLLVMLVFILAPVVINYVNYNSAICKYPELADLESVENIQVTIRPDGSIGSVIVTDGTPPTGEDWEKLRLASQIPEWKQTLVLPTAMDGMLGTMPSLGMFLVIILSASVVGSEYGWGTIRQLIARGTSRTNYLTAKLLTIVLVSVAGIVLVLCAGFIATIITTMLVEGNIEWSGFAGDFLISLVRILLILAVYLAFAACFAVLLRSPMSGIAVVAAWYFGEAIILALLSISTGWWAEAAKYFIGYNINHLLLLGSSNPPIDVQPWWRSAGILFGYIAVFICAAYYFLRRQDLTA